MGELRMTNAAGDAVWSLSGDQGNSWQAATVGVYSPSFGFEYTRGSAYEGDAAVALVAVSCGAAPPPMPPPPSPSPPPPSPSPPPPSPSPPLCHSPAELKSCKDECDNTLDTCKDKCEELPNKVSKCKKNCRTKRDTCKSTCKAVLECQPSQSPPPPAPSPPPPSPPS
eukprot:scaffold114832_cov69-Phaeocystis_antarctica.AAC.1